jgi:hypothetical protein
MSIAAASLSVMAFAKSVRNTTYQSWHRLCLADNDSPQEADDKTRLQVGNLNAAVLN